MNIPVKVVQTLMGHASFETTMNIYATIEQEYNNTIQDKVKVNMGDGTYIYSSYATKDTTIRIVK